MILIKKNLIDSQLFGLESEDLKDKIRSLLSYTEKSQVIARAIAKKKWGRIPKSLSWDGRVTLLDNDNKFPTGLLEKIEAFLTLVHLDYQIIEDAATLSTFEKKDTHDNFELWTHQKEALETIKSEKRGMVQIATAGGKTVIATVACETVGQYPFIFIVNRLSLLQQTHAVFSSYFEEEIGWLGDGKIDVKTINIASIATLCSILKIKEKDLEDENTNYSTEQIEQTKELLQNCRFVVVDELHHCQSKTYQYILKNLPNAHYRIGLSATPFSNEGKDLLLEAAFGKIIYQKSASDLIDEGLLCPPKIYFIVYSDEVRTKKYPIKSKKAQYTSVYKACVVENDKYNNIVADCALASALLKRSTLVSVRQIKHGAEIFNILNKKMATLEDTFKIVLLTGQNSAEEIKLAKEQFQNKEIDIFISTLLDEGVDLPILDAVVDAGGGSSPIKTIQVIGRALRKYPGKKCAYVYMFAQPYSFLFKHASEKISLLQQEPKFKIKVIDWENATG